MDFLLWGFEDFCKAHTTTRKTTPTRVQDDAMALSRLFDDQIEKDISDLDFIGGTDTRDMKEKLRSISSVYIAKFISDHSS